MKMTSYVSAIIFKTMYIYPIADRLYHIHRINTPMYQINHLTQTHTMLNANRIVRVMSLTYQWDRAQVYMVTILSVSHDVHQKWGSSPVSTKYTTIRTWVIKIQLLHE